MPKPEKIAEFSDIAAAQTGPAADASATETSRAADQLRSFTENSVEQSKEVYARMRSGLAIMGDAKFWWERARTLYARLSHPVEEAVMVFSGSKRLRRGHVAVVTDIVSPREIIVDQANWQNRGEIDHATPVLDVSRDNDWSRVRVWNIRSGQFGAHVYPVSGFIAMDLVRQASAD